MTYCGDNCGAFGAWWSKGCKAKRTCVCDVCAPLQARDLRLYESCAQSCNSDNEADRPKDKDSYLCEKIGPEALWSIYHIAACGFDPTKTIEAQQNKERQTQIDAQGGFQQKLILALAAIAGFAILVFIIKRNN